MKTERQKQAYPEILFLFPSFKEEDFSSFVLAYHLGAGYILAYLQKKGIYVTQFINKEPIGLDGLTDKILKQRPKIVGFTCYDANYYFVKLISQLLKKKNPKLTIMVGGPTATFSDELIMQDNSAIDICVRGEGEYTAYEIVNRLRKSLDVSDIAGITYRLKGRLIRAPDRPLMRGEKKGEELDIFPSPYLNGIFPPDENVGIITSRGCTFKCVYCNYSAMSRWTIRYHSVERIISELKELNKKLQSNNDKITCRFADDAFTLNIERAKQICRKIINEKIHLTFWADTRVDRIDEELLQLMYQAGFEEINFGLESAVPKVLNTIKKVNGCLGNRNNFASEKRFIAKMKKNVKLAKEIGLNPTVSVILGLPSATMKDDKQTLEFINQLKIEKYFHDYLNIFSGTELFNTHRKHGLRVQQSFTVLPYQTEYTYNVYKIPEIKNSMQSFVKSIQMDKMMEIFTGSYRNQQGENCSDLLFRNNSTIDKKMIEWLRRSVIISPRIGFVGNYFDGRFVRQNIEKMVFAGVPAINFYLLTAFNKKNANPAHLDFETGTYKIALRPEILSNSKKSLSKLYFLRFIPFANYNHNRSALLDLKKEGSVNIIFTVFTLDDIERLIRLVSNSKKIVLSGDMMKFDCYFLDECRWSDEDCPAMGFRRSIIGNDGSIIPCFNGKPIARVGDNHRDIIRDLRSMWDDVKRKRDCMDCSVRDSCSKCLFPYPMNNRDFCQIKRRKYLDIEGINKLLRLFKAIRKIRALGGKLLQKSKIDRVVSVFNNEMSIIDIGRKKYLYHHNSEALYKS